MQRTIRGRLPDGPVVEVALRGSQIASITEIKQGTGEELLLSPGLIDLQVNGYGGHDVNRPNVLPDEIAALTRRLWAEGVTAYCPTLITASREKLVAALASIGIVAGGESVEANSIACIHVEGPFISAEDGPRGAHDKSAVRPPDFREFLLWQEAAQGRVGIVTLAPEMPGAVEFTEKVAATGVLVAMGHTAANHVEISAVAEAGARLSTHLGNGCHAMIPRHPNHLWSQLDDERLSVSLIVDGHHLPGEVVRVMLRAKTPERVVLISDSSHLGGLEPGIYQTPWGAPREVLPDGRICIPGTPYLAASSSSLRQCVAKAAQITGLSLSQVLAMATANPARLLGRADLGCLAPGARADLILFRYDGELTVEETIVAGRTVYERSAVVAPEVAG